MSPPGGDMGYILPWKCRVGAGHPGLLVPRKWSDFPDGRCHATFGVKHTEPHIMMLMMEGPNVHGSSLFLMA